MSTLRDSVNYVYDKAGNPTSRKELGLTTAYTFNNLNQFSSGSWTGKLTVIGEVNYAAGTVTVNGVTGKVFPDRVFEATNITVSAGTNVLTAVYHGPAFTNTQMVATNTSSVVVVNPAFGYDAKGNLTNDAEFVYQYDIANRLTNVISKASGSSVLAARYDELGRRVEATRFGANVERYVYFPGSFLVLAVLDGSNQIKEVWSRGPDLSGGLDGAGGIGGVLSVSTNIGAALASNYFHADAMGNIVLVTGSSGQQSTQYHYSPFGRLVSQIGSYQARFAFSSKETDPETGLILYGFRYLSTGTGIWTTRDIIGEWTGPNLYGFVFNSPFRFIDPDGLAIFIPGANLGGGAGQDFDFESIPYTLGGVNSITAGPANEPANKSYGIFDFAGDTAAVALMLSPGGAARGGSRFLYDPRAYSTVSRAYWRARSGAGAMSLHHWLFPQRWTWVPQGLRNAGFNLLVVPRGFNSWMGYSMAGRWAETGIRLAIPGAIGGSIYGGAELGDDLNGSDDDCK